MELILSLLVVSQDFFVTHGETLGSGILGASGGSLATYFAVKSHISEKMDRALKDIKSTMDKALNRIASSSSERDAYLERRLDDIAREARDNRQSIHERITLVGERVSRLEGRLNGHHL
jgi:RNA-splicing ligase RtcB